MANFYSAERLTADGSAVGAGASAVKNSKGLVAHHRFDVVWSADASAGVVTVECAPSDDYAGDWHELAVMPWSAGGRVDSFFFTGPLHAVRMRITTLIANGSVSTFYSAV